MKININPEFIGGLFVILSVGWAYSLSITSVYQIPMPISVMILNVQTKSAILCIYYNFLS